MNKLLLRQIKKVFGDVGSIPQELASFLQIVDVTYDEFDKDRELTVRSLELSSQELIVANQKIRMESERQKTILEALKSATEVLQPTSHDAKGWLTSKDEVIYLASSLKNLIEKQKEHERDIEESKNITEKEKAKADAILQSIGDGVFAVDLNHNIILMNSVAEHLSGFSFEEAKGKYYRDIFQFIHEKTPDAAYPLFVEDVIHTGVMKKLENHTILINKNQTKLPISDSAAPIRDNKKNIFGCIVVIRDASREREIERIKDEFILIAAHQLRTPLGSMRWTIEMLLTYKEISQKVREKVERIAKSNKRMMSLVNDLLHVAQIDQGKIQDEPEYTDVYAVINEKALEMEAEARSKNVTINISLEKNIPTIVIDKKRFRDIIQNLLSNAIKYNVVGGNVKLAAKFEGSTIHIWVTDNGIGIPKNDQERVFSKFYRAANATKSDTTGSGLGLFVVKSYVEEWGGKVHFESIQGKGSTFYIEIPVKSINATMLESSDLHATISSL